VLFEVHIGPGTQLRVEVKPPEPMHEIQSRKLQEWLAEVPEVNGQVTKARLPKVLMD
jgi:hypothetical protein